MTETNLKRLQKVACGLGELNESIVYVGGAVMELYVADPAATDVRPTIDIDCVSELASYSRYGQLEELLRKKGFRHDQTPGAPICRWIYQGVIVDIMPDNEGTIGFSNRWYHPAMASKEAKVLPDGRKIYVLSVMYFLATKIEAMLGRGGSDLRTSHDFEDIVYLLNSCPDIIDRYAAISNQKLKDFLQVQFAVLIARPNIREEIACALPIGEEERTVMICEIMEYIAFYA